MTSPTKYKWSRADAIPAAKDLCDRLRPLCERIIVAGSLRRMKSEVSDVEILYIPKYQEQLGLWGSEQGQNLADVAIQSMLDLHVISKRLNTSDRPTWGALNKLAVHRYGVPIDLFQTDHASWFNYLVCRTGPAESNIRIASEAERLGFRWNPYGSGFTRLSDGQVFPMDSEEAVFSFVGLPYLEPKNR